MKGAQVLLMDGTNVLRMSKQIAAFDSFATMRKSHSIRKMNVYIVVSSSCRI